MNLDELRSVQNKERQKDSLQHLRESFYEDVAGYVEGLEDDRARAAEEAEDPFASPEVRRLTDEIETAKEVTRAIYERRLGKLVKRASLAAADMPADEEGLTAEERELFSDLVDRIERNKSHVLDVLEGEVDDGSGPDAGSPSSDGVSASLQTDPESSVGAGRSTDEADEVADASAESADASPEAVTERKNPPDDAAADGPAAQPPADEPVGGPSGEPPDAPPADREPADGEGTGDEAPADGGGASDDPSAGMDDRTTVRITRDVGEIFGVDQREYDLATEEVVTLPAENAEPLLDRGAAERID